MDIIDKLRKQADSDEAAGTLYAHIAGREAATEIEQLRSMYVAQRQCTDKLWEKYCAEVERKSEPYLMARVAEIEQSLAAVSARLARAQDALNRIAETTGSDDPCRPMVQIARDALAR